MKTTVWGAKDSLHTVTFRFPTTFRKALAASLGRPGQIATLPEVDAFLREAALVNVQACIDDYSTPPVKRSIKAKVRRPS